MNTLKQGTTLLAIAVLGACTALGPDRDPPQMPKVSHYGVNPTSEAIAAADASNQHLLPGAPPVPQWWKAYGSEDLNGLVEEGLAHSPSLAAAQGTLRAAHEGLRSQIAANVLPSVDLGTSATRQRQLGLPILPKPTLIDNVYVAQVQTSYSFNFFGAQFLADRALERQYQQQAFQFESVRRELAANIVIATINAAALQEQVASVERLAALGEQRAAQMAERRELGSASHDEQLAAERDAAQLSATLPPLRAQLLAVRHAQAVLLGRTPDQAPVPLEFSALHVPAEVPVSLPSDLLHQRPDILAAEAAVRAAADAAGAATATLFPSLTLSGSYGRGGFDWSNFTSPAGAIWSAGAMITQPIFHGGELVARRRQYEATYEAAVAQYRQTVLQAFEQVADDLANLEEDANGYEQAARADRAAAARRDDATSRYQMGAVSRFDAWAAGEDAENAHVNWLRARTARLAATANLYQAMGNPKVGSEENRPRAAQLLMGAQ